jgi:hypothetical protein
VKYSVARCCDYCKKYGQVAIKTGMPVSCPNCQKGWGQIEDIAKVLDYCPVCQCRQFYISKDFNQFVGCLIMLIGIILVPFTYGLSLPVFALIDWLLHRRVPTIINCYRCGSEFRGFSNKNFKPFMHHIGMKYDKFR